MGPHALDALVPIFGMLTGVAVIGTIGWTVRHWVTLHYGRRASAGEVRAEDVERLAERMTALEETLVRVQELEERLDFAERVLTRERDRGRLGSGGET